MPDTIDLPTLELTVSAIGQFCWHNDFSDFCRITGLDPRTLRACEAWHALQHANDGLKLLKKENALRAIVTTSPNPSAPRDEA